MKHPLFLIHFGKRLGDKLPVKENTEKKRKKEERKKEKIRIENKPNGTLLTLCIMLKYYPNN